MQLAQATPGQPGRADILALLLNKKVTIAYAVAYCVFLSFLYRYYLVPEWGYYGFYWRPSVEKSIAASLAILTVAALTPSRADTRSVFLQLSSYMHFFPSLIYFAASDGDVSYFLALVTGIGLFLAASFFPVKRLIYTSLTWENILYISTAFSVVTLALLVFFAGVGSFNLSLAEVYYYRAEARENLPQFLAYMRPMTTKVFLPIMLIVAFARGNRVLQALSLVLVVLFFAFTHHKAVIASALVTLILFYVFSRYRQVRMIGVMFITLMLICLTVFYVNTSVTELPAGQTFNSMVIRRTLFVPPLLDGYHLEYFQDSGHTYWSQSKISLGFVNRVYDINTPFLIGLEYFGRQGLAANTGFIGSGYSNAGYLGIMLYAVIMGVTLSYLNKCGQQVGHPLVIGAAFTQVIGAVTTSDLPSVFLTNGLIVLVLFFMVFPRRPL